MKGLQYKTYQKVLKAFEYTNYCTRFKAISFDGSKCTVQSRTMFKNDLSFEVTFEFDKKTTVAQIGKILEKADNKKRGDKNIGNTVYTNYSMQGWYFKKENRPYEANVTFIGFNGVDNYINVDFGNGHMFQFKFSDIGKTIFLTKLAAETALKEMEGNK